MGVVRLRKNDLNVRTDLIGTVNFVFSPETDFFTTAERSFASLLDRNEKEMKNGFGNMLK